jgi:hypothetical protein
MNVARSSRLAALGLALLLCGTWLPACTVMSVRTGDSTGDNHAFVSGYLTAGWPESADLIDLRLLKGHNDGAILWFNLWKLVRLEVGLWGAAIGIGPLDAGFGVLFYDVRPPEYSTNWFGIDGRDEEDFTEGPDA